LLISGLGTGTVGALVPWPLVTNEIANLVTVTVTDWEEQQSPEM